MNESLFDILGMKMFLAEYNLKLCEKCYTEGNLVIFKDVCKLCAINEGR